MTRLGILCWGLVAMLLVACANSSEQKRTAAEYYERGLQFMNGANYESAIVEFRQIEFLYPLSDYVQPSKLQIISANYGFGQYAEASTLAEDFITFYPDAYQVDFAYYMLGRSQYADGSGQVNRLNKRDLRNIQAAFAAFKRLVDTYPESEYVAESYAHLRHIRNVLARDEVEAARFYYERKAYVATINRCLYVVENYPRAPAVANALALALNAYKRLDLDEQAEQVRQLIDEHFTRQGS